ncbi:MAG: polysaccharide export protein [Desulfobacteraceae bacterium]|nr:polysaccharide export protein [Desulfobacteraceae bacterium]
MILKNKIAGTILIILILAVIFCLSAYGGPSKSPPALSNSKTNPGLYPAGATNESLPVPVVMTISEATPVAAAQTVAPSSKPDQAYTIGAGDVLNISVWKNPDLTQQLVVFPDGTLQFPLVGELKVAGLSVQSLTKTLTSKLQKYVNEPVVTISISQVNSMMVYVLGKVNKPGGFKIYDHVDVLQALCLAGGLTPYAKEKDIRIFRKTGGNTQIFQFNYKAVSNGKDLDQNIFLQRGDVIIVR